MNNLRSHTQPCDESNYAIIKVNDAPDCRLHVSPWEGPAIDWVK